MMNYGKNVVTVLVTMDRIGFIKLVQLIITSNAVILLQTSQIPIGHFR
jgi:hypothetical protein